jgi:hypothetical protein
LLRLTPYTRAVILNIPSPVDFSPTALAAVSEERMYFDGFSQHDDLDLAPEALALLPSKRYMRRLASSRCDTINLTYQRTQRYKRKEASLLILFQKGRRR